MTISEKAALRKLAYVPLVATTIAAAVVCITAGESFAATETDAPPVLQLPPAPSSELGSHWWSLRSESPLPVWGQLEKEQGGKSSEISFGPEAPMHFNEIRQTQQHDIFVYQEYTQGRFCLDHSSFVLPRANYHADEFFLVRRVTDPGMGMRMLRTGDPGSGNYVDLQRDGSC